jgi:hypothetical protein
MTSSASEGEGAWPLSFGLWRRPLTPTLSIARRRRASTPYGKRREEKWRRAVIALHRPRRHSASAVRFAPNLLPVVLALRRETFNTGVTRRHRNYDEDAHQPIEEK